MQINQQLVRFNRVLTKEISKKVLKILGTNFLSTLSNVFTHMSILFYFS